MRNAKPEMNSRNMNEVFWNAELNETSTAVKRDKLRVQNCKSDLAFLTPLAI